LSNSSTVGVRLAIVRAYQYATPQSEWGLDGQTVNVKTARQDAGRLAGFWRRFGVVGDFIQIICKALFQKVLQ
jgi:hypothetical protein